LTPLTLASIRPARSGLARPRSKIEDFAESDSRSERIDISSFICYAKRQRGFETMPISEFWEKTLGVLVRAQDEIVKVSQFGKTQIDRSFLVHERNKLYSKLGELSYSHVKEKKIQFPEAERVVDQIDRLTKKIEEMAEKMKDLTRVLRNKLDVEQDTDVIKREVSAKKMRVRKKKIE
jgi:NADH/NAD ratio-sensing transcriptional regulator Rex